MLMANFAVINFGFLLVGRSRHDNHISFESVICLSLTMHHGQKWRPEIASLQKILSHNYIKPITKRKMLDLKGKIELCLLKRSIISIS